MGLNKSEKMDNQMDVHTYADIEVPLCDDLSHLLQVGSTKRDINVSKYLKSYLSLSYGFSIDGNNYSGFKVNISSDEKRHKMPMILHDNEMTPL